MKKIVKRGVVDRYIKKNPLAPASVVSRETGCHAATVYLSRKRLGLPTRLSEQNAALFAKVERKPQEPPPVANAALVQNQEMQNAAIQVQITELQSKFAFAKAAITGLFATVVALAVAFVFTFKP
jgi:hypothetical protein